MLGLRGSHEAGGLKRCAVLFGITLEVGWGSQKSPVCPGVFSSGVPVHFALCWAESTKAEAAPSPAY